MSGPRVSAVLGEVLRAHRAEFNTRFAEMKRRRPGLEGETFSEALVTLVDPVVEAVSRIDREAVAETVSAAYDIMLLLVAEKLAGPAGRHSTLNEACRDLLPKAAERIAEAPLRMLGAVTNALVNLATTPEVREAEWIRSMEAVVAQCETVEMFLQAGQVAGWRCGLAQYRESALAIARRLPSELGSRLIGTEPGAQWEEVVAKLERERWWQPGEPAPKSLQVVRRAGAFRGFGGAFTEPPLVAAIEEDLYVWSGDNFWLLTADAFGATFHRVKAVEFEAAAEARNAVKLEGDRIVCDGRTTKLPMLGTLTSAAATSDTVALTGSLTHAVMLLAR